jgi:hypothetical protein
MQKSKSIGKAAKTIRLQTKLVKLALQKYFVRKTTNAEVLKPRK